MKESALNNNVLQILDDFETSEEITPSIDWTESLMKKIYSAKVNSKSMFTSSKFASMVLIIAILNIGLIIGAVINDSRHANLRNKNLQIISEAFLINPTSSNN